MTAFFKSSEAHSSGRLDRRPSSVLEVGGGELHSGFFLCCFLCLSSKLGRAC